MARPNTGIFSGSRFVRWTVIPCAILCGIVVLFPVDGWSRDWVWKAALIEAVLLLLVLAVAWPRQFGWAGRVLATLVFLGYSWYFVSEYIARPEGLKPTLSMGNPSAWNALRGWIVFGLPSLWYAVRGRFGFGPRKDTDEPQ